MWRLPLPPSRIAVSRLPLVRLPAGKLPASNLFSVSPSVLGVGVLAALSVGVATLGV